MARVRKVSNKKGKNAKVFLLGRQKNSDLGQLDASGMGQGSDSACDDHSDNAANNYS